MPLGGRCGASAAAKLDNSGLHAAQPPSSEVRPPGFARFRIVRYRSNVSSPERTNQRHSASTSGPLDGSRASEPLRAASRGDDAQEVAVALTRALERCEVPADGFHHTSHLRVAWVYLAEHATTEGAADRMAATLRRFAAAAGHPEKYHHTMTLFWVRRLAVEQATRPDASLDDILTHAPALLDKNLPLAYYSPGRLFSEEARASWLDPDMRPLETRETSSRPAYSSGDPPDRPVSGRST
jgi:hypothetical protein